MASGPNVGGNLLEAERLINLAVDDGAQLIVLPENFALMGMEESDKLQAAEQPGQGPIQDFLAQQASKNEIWLVGGTLPIATSDPNKVRAASLIYNSQGEQVGRYDKIHLFDVVIGEDEEAYRESASTEPGDQVLVVDTPVGRLGVAICYDLRFPELFRVMLDQGVQLIALPSAFTSKTGRAHWKPLVRARAIENSCYMIAANQGGFHVNGRTTHGNSMIIEPWGGVLARQVSGAGVVSADLDMARLDNIRRNFPVGQHRRLQCSLPNNPQ